MPLLEAALIGSSLIGAGTSIYGANQASDAAKKASKQANAELARQYDLARMDLAPYRYGGVQAYNTMLNELGLNPYANPNYRTDSGYGQQGYVTVKGNVGGGSGGSGGGGLAGAMAGGGLGAALGAAGSVAGPIGAVAGGLIGSAIGGGGEKPVVGGTIDPYGGTVDAQGGSASRDDVFTHYLRTGEWTGDPKDFGKKKYQDLISTINRMRAGGYEYGTNSQQAAEGKIGGFTASPGYQFVRDEGQRGIMRTAAARGGLSSGATLRALDQFNSGLASQEYGNWWNRLAATAGVGQTATQQGAALGANYANNSAANTMQAGDARASAYLTNAATINNTLNTGLNNWMLYRGGYFNNPAGGYQLPADIRNFQYPFGG